MNNRFKDRIPKIKKPGSIMYRKTGNNPQQQHDGFTTFLSDVGNQGIGRIFGLDKNYNPVKQINIDTIIKNVFDSSKENATINEETVKPLFYCFPYPQVSLRLEPQVLSKRLDTLDYKNKLAIIEEIPGGWYYVQTDNKKYGYVASHLVNTDLPDSNSILYLIKQGDTAQGIVKDHYGAIADKQGQDQRFFVNVLVYANGEQSGGIYKKNPDDKWSETVVKAGAFIWLPSQEYASIIAGEVKSGSISHDTYQAVRNLTNYVLSVSKALSCILGGIGAGYLDSQSLGIKHQTLYFDMLSIASNPDLFKIGYAAGSITSIGQGIGEILTGIGGEVGGVILDSTGVGALVGVPLNIASAALITHGAAVTLAGGTLAAQTIKDMVFEMSTTKGTIKTGGYKTFNAFKKAQGKAGRGKEWHHVVEQSQIKKTGFLPEKIHNIKNIIAVKKGMHNQISGFYTRYMIGTKISLRNWLKGKSFKHQYEYGLKVLKEFGIFK